MNLHCWFGWLGRFNPLQQLLSGRANPLPNLSSRVPEMPTSVDVFSFPPQDRWAKLWAVSFTIGDAGQ
jgi:hypothetical protein